MKKTILSLAVLGSITSITGIAHAQPNVRIYGTVDTGYIKESGRDIRMGCNYGNMIGFAGNEDLGRGLKAVFTLESWLELNDGDRARRKNEMDFNRARGAGGNEGVRRPDFQGQANIGLEHSDWGAVRLGRVYNLSIENYRRLDPFFNFSVGADLAYGNNLYAETLSNTVRYDSPVWQGFSFGLSYSLGENDRNNTYYMENGNDGWNVTLKYDNGPLFLTSNYYRMADSGNSHSWNVGGAYTWGAATISLGYQDSRTRFADAYANATWMLPGRDVDQRDAILGLAYKTGSGEIQASLSHANWDDGVNDENVWKYALGYTHFLSKRTSIYGMVSYMDAGTDFVGKHYNFTMIEKSEIVGVQVGMRHSF